MTERQAWAVAAALAVCGALLYAGGVGHGYVLDDASIVQQNPVVNEGRVVDACLTPYWPPAMRVPAANWRPLATLSWTLERAWAGPPVAEAGHGVRDPALPLFHGLNALLHGLCVLLCFPLARRALGAVRPAWVATALFAVHPAHTEVVAPVVGRIDLLAAIGALATLWCWCRHRETGRWAWCAAAAGAYAVGLGGKEAAAPMLLLLPLADRWWLGRPWATWRTRAAWSIAPLVGVACVYAAVRVWVLGGHTLLHGQAETLGLWGRLGFAARNTWVSLGLLAAPVRFHHLITTLPREAPFTYPQPGPVLCGVWLAAALPVWFGWLALARRAPAAALCWVAALAHWAPTSGLLPVAAGVSLRFLFLPTAFAAIGAVLAGRAVWVACPRWRPALRGAALVWGVGATGLTLWRMPQWATNRRFFEAVLAESPRCYKALYSVGAEIAIAGGDILEARGYMERAIAVAGDDPISVEARRNLAKTYEYPPGGGERYGPGADLERAVAVYDAALALVPDSAPAHLDVGAVHEQLRARARAAGDTTAFRRHTAQVVAHLTAVCARQPDHPQAPEFHLAIAQRQVELGAAVAARDAFRAAVARAAVRHAEHVQRGQPGPARLDRDLAVAALTEALATAPPPDEATALRAELDRWRHTP